MARLLGRYTRPWCPYHRAPAGMDCPDSSPSKRAQRAYEERQWRREAEDEMSEEQDKQEMGGISPTYQVLDEAAEYAETGTLRPVGPGNYPNNLLGEYTAPDMCEGHKRPDSQGGGTVYHHAVDGELACKPTGVAEAVAERLRRKPTWIRTSNRREALKRASQLAAGGYGGEDAQGVVADARVFEAYLNEPIEGEDA